MTTPARTEEGGRRRARLVGALTAGVGLALLVSATVLGSSASETGARLRASMDTEHPATVVRAAREALDAHPLASTVASYEIERLETFPGRLVDSGPEQTAREMKSLAWDVDSVFIVLHSVTIFVSILLGVAVFGGLLQLTGSRLAAAWGGLLQLLAGLAPLVLLGELPLAVVLGTVWIGVAGVFGMFAFPSRPTADGKDRRVLVLVGLFCLVAGAAGLALFVHAGGGRGRIVVGGVSVLVIGVGCLGRAAFAR